jgi:hypothetical protein
LISYFQNYGNNSVSQEVAGSGVGREQQKGRAIVTEPARLDKDNPAGAAKALRQGAMVSMAVMLAGWL